MTREQIKQKMLASIQENLNAELDALNFDKLIDEEMVSDFMWERDFGKALIDDYIEEHKSELVESYLEEILDEIETDDLETPW